MDTIFSINPYDEFNEDSKLSWIQDEKLVEPLEEKIDEMIDNIYCSLEDLIQVYASESNYTIYNGYGGTTFVSYQLYKKTKNIRYLEVAKKLTSLALQNLKGECISFLNGDAGPIALGILINMIEKNYQSADNLIGQLIRLGDAKKQNPFVIVENDILNGRAGYLYALLFLDQELDEPVIPELVIRQHVHEILISGYKLSKKEGSLVPLEFECYERKFVGAAHGIAGILYILLIANRYMTDYELNCLVRPTLNSLITLKLPGNNFPVVASDRDDELIQWCHGVTGIIHLASAASIVYTCPAYNKLALELSETVWNRGLLKKGSSICHGAAGNAYIFLHFYKKTYEESFLYKAACFADFCLNYPNNEGMRSDWPYSLFQGSAGVLQFLLDVKEPHHAYFPGYELEIS